MHFHVLAQSTQNIAHKPNQDYYVYAKNEYGQSLFAIADGVGSYSDSAKISKLCCLFLKQKFLTTNFSGWNDQTFLNWGNKLIQQDLQYEIKKIVNKVSTTLSFLIVTLQKIYIFHVGNTRIYQKKTNSDTLYQLTHDEENKNLKDNFFFKKHHKMLDNSISNFRNTTLQFSSLSLFEGFLFFCTDGLHNFVALSEMETIFNNKKNSPKEIVQYLTNQALYSGSIDDITLLLVKISKI